MSDNKHNLLFFEASDAKSLYNKMDEWQYKHGKRLLSTSIVVEDDKICCIALSNPTEVVIVDAWNGDYAGVNQGTLNVTSN